MKGSRLERVAEELRQVLSEILLYKIKDPRMGQAVVSRVQVSGDLGHAQVHVSVIGDQAERERTLQALEHAAPYVRSVLARSVRLRKVPELHFHADLGVEHSLRLQESLRELGLDQQPDEGVGSEGEEI